MAADGRLQLFFIYIAALHDKLISDHDGRGFWQPQFGIFFGTILLIGSGCGLDFHLILFPQPGDDFSEMPSGLAAGLIFENSYFQHDFHSFCWISSNSTGTLASETAERITVKG